MEGIFLTGREKHGERMGPGDAPDRQLWDNSSVIAGAALPLEPERRGAADGERTPLETDKGILPFLEYPAALLLRP